MAAVEIFHKNPYPNQFLLLLDKATLKCMALYSKIVDILLGCLFHTTKELQEPYKLIPGYLIVFPMCVIGMVIGAPFLAAAFLLWCSFQWKKTPYRISTTEVNDTEDALNIKSTYTFMTTNLCLLHESLSKFNNLDNTRFRSSMLGHRIITARTAGHDMNGHNGRRMNSNKNKPQIQTMPFEVSILSHVDPPDFLIIQEGSWVLEYGKLLGKQLHRVYPYVIHDIAKHSLFGNMCIGTSGLMFASKYPLMDIQFRAFKDSCHQCNAASKGLLHVKVPCTCLFIIL